MNVFAYGSLQLDEIMEAVAGRRFEGAPAVLEGYRRRRLTERSYPAVVPRDGERTQGVVFRGIDDEALKRLDEFEEDLYLRQELTIQTMERETLSAWVYVLAPAHEGLLSDEVWDLQDFARRHAEGFVARYRQATRDPRGDS